MSRGLAGFAKARFDEVAIVIPLDVVDVVGLEDLDHLIAHMRVRLGNREVEDLLVTRLIGQPLHRRAHDPLGMLACHGRVLVDHFRLEPQAKLHAVALDVLDERREPVRPHVRADNPVAEARVVVAAIAKPAIVEHVALNTELRGAIREILETVEVMIEVDGLPDVQGDGAVRVHVVLARAQPRVETLRDLVEAHAVARVHER